MRRLARLAVTFVCAYALALMVILSGWTGNGAAAASGLSVICSEHSAPADGPPAGDDDHHRGLCAMLCSLQAAGMDAAPAPAGIAVRRSLLVSASGLARIESVPPPGYFPKDHQVRGPPLRIAA